MFLNVYAEYNPIGLNNNQPSGPQAHLRGKFPHPQFDQPAPNWTTQNIPVLAGMSARGKVLWRQTNTPPHPRRPSLSPWPVQLAHSLCLQQNENTNKAIKSLQYETNSHNTTRLILGFVFSSRNKHIAQSQRANLVLLFFFLSNIVLDTFHYFCGRDEQERSSERGPGQTGFISTTPTVPPVLM